LSECFLLVVAIKSEDAVFEIINNPQRIVELVGKRAAADPSDTTRFGLRCDGDRGKNCSSSRLIFRDGSVIVAELPQEFFSSVAPHSMDSLVIVAAGRILEVVGVLAPNALENCAVVLFVVEALFLRQPFEVRELKGDWFRNRVDSVVESFNVERALDGSVVEGQC
jgi:hypothetical protein